MFIRTKHTEFDIASATGRFFDVTVDELPRYELQLGKEQIRKIYFGFASEWAYSET